MAIGPPPNTDCQHRMPLKWNHLAWACRLLPVFLAAFTTRGEPSSAAAPEDAPVLCGCEFDYPPYCIVTADRQADGFSVELLRAALKAVDREAAFKTGAWSELKQGLADGTLRVLPLVGRTPERETVYDFTFPYLTMHGAIVVRDGRADIRGPADLKDKRVAVLSGDNAEEYLRRAELGAVIEPRPSFETALRELSAGEHDAVVIQKLLAFQLMQKAGLRNLTVAGPPLKEFTQSFCFATRKGDRVLLAALNEGLSIAMADGTFRALYAKWFSPIETLGRTKSRIMIGGDSNCPPYEFLDRNGQPAGFNVDLTRAIASRMGLSVDIQLGTWGTVRKNLSNGDIDLVEAMFYSAERDKELDFSPPTTVVQHAIVVRDGTPEQSDLKNLAGKAILVMGGDIMQDVAVKQGFEKQLIAVSSQEEALRLLSEGTGDCALVAKVPALYWIGKNGWRNLRVSNHSVLSNEPCYAALHGQELLLSQFSEGLAALRSTGEYRRIQAKWLSPYEPAGPDLRTYAAYALALIALLLLLLGGALLWSRSLQAQVAERTRLLTAEITERKRAEQEREVTIAFLRLVNETAGTAELIHNTLTFFKRHSGCDAVGIRLREGDDYPYYETIGFSSEFTSLENHLCQRDLAGQPVRDSVGNPVIECMCGNVLCGRVDPSKPFFTAHGSFWTSDTTQLLASTTEADRQSRTRNRCNGEGYDSVALLPLRLGEDRLGLLQLNNRAKGAFSLQTVEPWERLADYLAVALLQARTQEALKASEETYRSLFENMLNGFAYARMLFQDGQPVDFIYLSVNKAFEAHTGLKSVVGQRVTEAIPGILKSDPNLLNAYGRVASTGKPEVFERYVNALDRWFHISAYSPIKDHFVSVFADITERKRSEESLRESESRFRTLIEAAPDAVFVQSEGRFTYLNPAMLRLFGAAQPSELINTDAFARIAPEWHQPIRDRIRLQLDTGKIAPLMAQEYLRLDGSRVAVETTAVAIRVRNRDAHLVFVRDITARKAAETEREHLLTAIDQSSEVIVITDPSGVIQYVNPAFERVTGYTRQEALGQNPRVLKSSKHDATFYRELWLTITSGKTWRGRFVNKRRDGTYYNEEATISPVRDTSSRTVSYVAVKRDITEHIRLEAQLQQAQKMESVGRLAGGVAHDFNNMLSVILGCAELAQCEVAPDHPIFSDLHEIRKAAERSADLTRQLLAFARKQAVATKVLNLNDTVTMMLKMLRRLIGEDIELVWLPGAGDMTVKMDPSQIDQILANLAVNARDAIAGVGKLTIETGNTTFGQASCADHADAAPGEYVTLTVCDSGCGMDAATAEHIFEPFFTTKGIGEGTGLGLSTVYGIVQQNGGRINVASEPGLGTTFKIHLPRHQVPCATLQTEAPSAALSRCHETVLLVEDEQAVLKLGKRMLESLGYRVVTADTPHKALDWAAQHTGEIHLLLTDVIMPAMNGWDLAKRMRLIYPNLKILFMSGYTSNVIVHHEMTAYGAHFIQKPFSQKDLAAKVAEILNGP